LGIKKLKVPTFEIAMHVRDKDLIRAICCHFKLTSAVYLSKPYVGDGIKRGAVAKLVVREYEQLKDVIIPFFYKKLKGNKGKQFQEWLEKIGTDASVSKKFKTLHKIYRDGYYDDLTKRWFWEEREEKEIKERFKYLIDENNENESKINNYLLKLVPRRNS
jgi:hypothetical protein